MSTIKRILVTGSNGCVGTRLCETLLERGYDVVGVDRKLRPWSSEVGARTIQMDLCNSEDVLSRLPRDVDMIVHLAANARVHNLVADPTLAQQNHTATFNILELARHAKVPRFFFSSSRETYGNRPEYVNKEGDVDIRACPSPYTASKIADEAMVWAYSRCYGIDHVTFRLSNVYGMYDESDRVVPLFQKLALQGRDLVVFDRDKLLDFTYINDTIAGILLAIERFDRVKNQTYNVAFGEGILLLDVAKTITDLLGSPSKIIVRDNRPGEVLRHIADISKAKLELGYQPKTSFAEGIRRAIKWYAAHPAALEAVPVEFAS